MLRSKTVIICLCVLLAGGLTLAAQESFLSGPVSGFVFDRASRSIRPIVGLPGASYLGDALAAGLDWASVAPAGNVALAVKDGQLYALRGLGPEAPWIEIEEASPAIDRVAWAADGSAAALYSSAGSRLLFVRNLGESPAAAGAVDLPGRVAALALGASGECAVAGVEADRESGLYLACLDAPLRLLAATAPPAAIALAGSDLYVAEGATGRILQIRNYQEEATLMPFADNPGEAWDPVGLAVSADQRRLFVANRADRRVDAYDLESRALLGQFATEWEPSLLEPLALRSVFLLKSAGSADEPLLVLDAGREPAVYFVPAGRGE